MGLKLFETTSLEIRQLEETDLVDFHDLQSNENVLKYVGSPPSTMEQCTAEIKRLISSYKEENAGLLVWGIYRKTDHEFIGTCAYVTEDGGHEIGYRLREKHWKNGYGTELTPELLTYVFERYEVDEIWAEADVLNIGSVKILDRNLINQGKRWNEKDQCWDFHYLLTKKEHAEKRH